MKHNAYKILVGGEIQPTIYATYEEAQKARIALKGNMVVKIPTKGVKQVCYLP